MRRDSLPSTTAVGLLSPRSILLIIARETPDDSARASIVQPLGGIFTYLLEGYGPLPAFLFGWTELVVIRAAALEDSPFLGSALLEDELVALITRYTAPMI